MKEIEIWKDIPDYKGIYKVSSFGRIKSLKRVGCLNDRMLKQSLDNHGYFHVYLHKNGKGATKFVHKMVSIAFLGHVQCGYREVINHINGIPTDNRVDNLERTTQRFNTSEWRDKTKTTSKYTGVCWDESNKKWISQININGGQIYLGYFDNEELAKLTYDKAIKCIDIYNGNGKEFREYLKK